MKTILTHIAAFIAGVIALPVLLLIAVKTSPDCIPRLAQKAATGTGNVQRGAVALEKAKTEEERFVHLGRAAKELFDEGKLDEARRCAEELSSITHKHTDSWNYGNAIQDANVVLGRIAVREGNLGAAKAHLSEAGKSPGSPQMNSFGPNVSLAKDLLEKGEKDAVIAYFEACKKFWEMDRGRLDDWIALARAGRMPDFGANLVY